VRFLPSTNSERGVNISIDGLSIRGWLQNEQKNQTNQTDCESSRHMCSALRLLGPFVSFFCGLGAPVGPSSNRIGKPSVFPLSGNEEGHLKDEADEHKPSENLNHSKEADWGKHNK
jgi:hypothetical protein